MDNNYRAEITGVFGDPVEGNPTGVMEEAAYDAMGLNYRYITMKVTPEGFPDAMKAVRALHMKGVNLTMPHKIAVIPYLDELSKAATIIGAVNTVVVREDGSLFGENTDGKGFIEALLRRGSHPEGKNIMILGAGGAARAIAVECALAGAAKITVVNRTAASARELADLILTKTNVFADSFEWTPQLKIPDGTDILINATSIGLGDDRANKPDIRYDTITPDMTVSDVVFNPSNTLFLQEASKYGAQTVNGLGMLACQGARNFTLWTGMEAPLDVMIEKLREEFGEV